MIIIAASLYLPEHIATVASRAWFYYAGDETAARSGGIGANGVGIGSGGGQRINGNQVIDTFGRS